MNDREVAEEVAQDVFVKAYRCLADFRGDCRFSTWLYTIVNTTCLSALRRKQAPVQLFDDKGWGSLVSGQTSVCSKPDERLDHKWVLKAIRMLPEQDARIIALFYQADQTQEEIAQIMGITEANVKVRLYRARLKLRQILEPFFYGRKGVDEVVPK
jgi:RNA polymerase sigma-70 factor (ECF subfamily)